jgi:hypothetical protein
MAQMKVLVLLIVLAMSGVGVSQVQPTFFGMHVNKLTSMPLPLPIASIRLWDTGTNWFQLCPSGDYSRCDWQRLDKWLAAAKSNGISDVLYTFGKTPAWASSQPRGDCWGAKEGVCYPPRDLSSDGTGSDAAFRGFVRAIVEHNRNLNPDTYARIKFWGIWNEPHTKQFWRGRVQQLVRMTKDAREIIKGADPDALVLTPEAASNAKNGNYQVAGDWLDEYLSAGGGAYVDVIAFHIYANNNNGHPVAEEAVTMIQHVKSRLARHSEIAGKPLWMTEGSWGRSDDTNWRSPDQAVAFLMRYETLLAAEGIERVYWYSWDAGWGTLASDGGESPEAAAYRTMHDWLLGKKVTNCSPKSHVWSCALEGPNFKGNIAWNDENEKTANFDAKGFAAIREAGREPVALDPKAGRVQIGNKPVLLETATEGGR